MAVIELVRDAIAPAMAEMAVELVDVEQIGATLRVTIDQPGGVDLDLISRATRRISGLLDDADPLADRYTLEVSSPGLERTLRLPAHFVRASGSRVSIKTVPGTEGERRFTGTLVAAGDEGIEVVTGEVTGDPATGDSTRGERRLLRYDQIERARTVFEWGPNPKPGASRASKSTKKKAAAR